MRAGAKSWHGFMMMIGTNVKAENHVQFECNIYMEKSQEEVG